MNATGRKKHAGADARLRADPDRSSVGFDDILHDQHAEARPALARRRVKGLEDVGEHFGAHALAGVGRLEDELVAVAIGLQGEDAARSATSPCGRCRRR